MRTISILYVKNVLTICWGACWEGKKKKKKTVFSISSSRLGDCENLTALGQADILQLPPHFLLWRRGLLSDRFLHIFTVTDLFLKLCNHLPLVVGVKNLVRMKIVQSLGHFKLWVSVVILYRPSLTKRKEGLRALSNWLLKNSVHFDSNSFSVCITKPVCVCFQLSVYQGWQEGGNQLFPMMSYSLMYGPQKPTQKHWNTYLSLGQLNALYVREY